MLFRSEEFDKEAAQVNDLVTFFLELQCALQISHWKTTSFAEHKACEQIYDAIHDLADNMIESFQGKNAKINCNPRVELHPISTHYIDSCISKLDDLKKFGVDSSDKDLINIRDEIVGSLNKLLYLLRLH